MQRLEPLPMLRVSISVQLLNGQTDNRRRGIRRQRLAETDGHRKGEATRHLPEEATAVEAEDAAPDSIEMHRNDRSVYSFHDPCVAAAKWQELSDSGYLTFGKDADQFAAGDGITGIAQGAQHLARTQIRGYGNHSQCFQERLEVP